VYMYTSTLQSSRLEEEEEEEEAAGERQTRAAAAPSSRGSSREIPPREPADGGRGTGAAPGYPLVASFCRGVSFVGAGAGLGLPPGPSATLAFL